MSAPRDETTGSPNRPARGRLGRPAPAAAEPTALEPSEVLQGQSAAVLGALARMQLRLDVLAREQSDLFAQVLARLDELAATAEPVTPIQPVAWPESAPTEPPRSWGQ